MNKEQALKDFLKENYLLVKSKVFEKLTQEITFNPYTDRTVVFYNIIDEENDEHLVDILTWYWGDTYAFEKSPISVEELDKLIVDRTFIDTWVKTHVTFTNNYEHQIENLCKFPGLKNKELLVEEILERYRKEDRDTPYIDTILYILALKPCEECHEEFEDGNLRETNLSLLCDSCIKAITSRGEDVWVKQLRN